MPNGELMGWHSISRGIKNFISSMLTSHIFEEDSKRRWNPKTNGKSQGPTNIKSFAISEPKTK